MVSLDFLKTVDLLKGLDQDQLASIQGECEEKKYLRGKKFFGEGEEAKDLWIVVEGRIDLCFELPGRTPPEIITISSISAGESFGWSSFVPPYEYRYSAYGSGDFCTVLRVGKESLIQLFENDFTMGYRVMTNLGEIMSGQFKQLQESATVPAYAKVKIKVHMATCGIAAGAREIMNALIDELSLTEREDIQVETVGCIGQCKTEPNVTVEIEGENPVVYQKMTPEKMRLVVTQHVMRGEVLSEFVLT